MKDKRKQADTDTKRIGHAIEEAEALAKQAGKLRGEVLGIHREVDALLWQGVDSVSRSLLKLLTMGTNDIASIKVRARVPTAITIAYDDGWTYHSERRLGGIQVRPVILEFEHSDPGHVGSVRESIQYASPEQMAKFLENEVQSKPEGE